MRSTCISKEQWQEHESGTGDLKIEWARQYMPVLSAIREEFTREKPFKGMVIGMALHVEAKTANLVTALASGGARVYITGCNPLSTQDDVAEALNHVPGLSVMRNVERRSQSITRQSTKSLMHNR